VALLDYHAKNLLPSVWTSDGELTARFRSQLADQLKRFPDAKEVLLVGDAVSHYWWDDSDVDVLLRVPANHLVAYQQQAIRASGFPLIETENNVSFHIVDDGLVPNVAAKYFGPIYSVNTGLWHGRHVTDELEMISPDAVEQYVNWRLYKAKYTEDPFPDDWYIIAEAFMNLDEDEREATIDRFRQRVKKIDTNVRKLLKKQPRNIWRGAEQFDKELAETEEVPDTTKLPMKVVYALLHRFRYQDILDTLIQINENAIDNYDFRFGAVTDEDVPPPEDKEPVEEISMTVLRDRLDQLVTMMIQQQGGYGNAIEVMAKILSHILEYNRYIGSEIRIRRIVYRLYRRYYQSRS
jgi:hypothetical protein